MKLKFCLKEDYSYMFVVVISVISLTAVTACPNECVCQHKTVDCSYKKLQHIPTGIPPETQRL